MTIVARKELKDFFRDPRALLLSLGLPLILFPLLFWVLNENPQGSAGSHQNFRIAVKPPAELPLQIRESSQLTLTNLHENALEWRYSHDALITADKETGRLRIYYDNTDALSMGAYSFLKKTLSEKQDQPPRETGISENTGVTGMPLYPPAEAAGTALLGLILPFMFFIFAITCPLAGAADLSSGEKERGSLEPLLSTAASRSGIILGKLAAGTFTGLCSVGAYFLGCYLSFLITPEIVGQGEIRFSPDAQQVVILILLIIILTLLFTAVEITAGFITRSVREAQLLAMPLLTIGMGAVYTAQNTDLTGKAWFYSHIPLVNLALAVRETALNRLIPADIIWAVVWNLVYLFLMIILAVSMFQKEFSFVKTSKTGRLLARSHKRRYSI